MARKLDNDSTFGLALKAGLLHYLMTPEEKEAQRRSFAYGNTHLANPDITRDMIVEEVEKMEKP